MRTGVAVACRVLLGALHALTALVVALAWAFQPEDRWDREMLDAAGLCALLGGAAAATAALLTWPAVALAGLRGRWYGPPAVLLAAAVVRYVYLDRVYQPW